MLIAGRYEILSQIGQGGMGIVYHATDTQTGHSVAIKQLKESAIQFSPELLTRFQREGEALRELNHPNIVKMLDMIEDNGESYLVVEYIGGGDLQQLLQSKTLSFRQILQISLELADALTRAHHLKIIHRDLKPANVLIADDGTPRLTDFGVALISQEDRVTETGAVVGTFDYLAPESLDGRTVDNRADIWSFGVMLFEMLTGQRPFAGESVGQVVTNILTQPLPDLETLKPDAPIALIDLIGRMLDKDPNHRISSIRLVGAELEAILQGNMLDTKSSSTPIKIQAGRFNESTPISGTIAHHNLPVQTTPFVGREAEVAELMTLVTDPQRRLITIMASGGMGKTRLAIQSASMVVDQTKDGVAFVELAPLSFVDDIPSAIADAVGYQMQPVPMSPLQQVVNFLQEKEMLLVLDNFEHLADGVGIVNTLLKGAPLLQILVTSRVKLGLSGETIFNLGGMDFPDWETPEDALEYSAVKLFMQSAKRVMPDFELDADNLHYVARICRLAQGMPLGILLAASWLDNLSPEEIADEMSENIDFLETELHDLPERQQSIRAVFDYSWNLLKDNEREVFARLSVFRGGFIRDMAKAITGASLRDLTTLMNKSLITRDTDSGRYHIHELLRQFALEQLDMMGEKDATLNAYAVYYANWQVQSSQEDMPTDPKYMRLVQDEFDNMKHAWYRLLEVGDLDNALAMTRPLYYIVRVLLRESDGIALFQQARRMYDIPIEDATHPFERFIYTHMIDAEPDRYERLQRALPVMQALGDIEQICFVKFSLGVITTIENDPEVGRDYLLQVLDEIPENSQLRLHLPVTWYLTHVYQMLGDYNEADQWISRLNEMAHNIYIPYIPTANLERLYLTISECDLSGDYSSTESIFDVIISYTTNMSDVIRGAETQVYQGFVALREGRIRDAKKHAQYVLQENQSGNILTIKAKAYALLGQVALCAGDYQQAREYTQLSENQPRHFAGFREVDYNWTLLHLTNGDYQKAGQALVKFLKHNRTNAIKYVKKFGEQVYYTHAFLPILAGIEQGLGNTERALCLYQRFLQNKLDHSAWAEELPVIQNLSQSLATDDEAIIKKAQALDLLTLVPDLLASYTES